MTIDATTSSSYATSGVFSFGYAPPGYFADAACKGEQSSAFYPERGESKQIAKTICAFCPVRRECLEYAIENNERFGIWGGKDIGERRKIRRGMGLKESKPQVVAILKSECPSGHAKTPENTAIDNRGYRRCKVCHRTRQAARDAETGRKHNKRKESSED